MIRKFEGKASIDEAGRRSIGLAIGLVLDGGPELASKIESRVLGKDLAKKPLRQHFVPTARNVETGCDFEQIPLDILRRVDRGPVVANDHLKRAGPAIYIPTRTSGESPGHMTTCVLVREAMVIELASETDIMEEGRDTEEFRVELIEALNDGETARPKPGTDAVIRYRSR